MSDKSLGIALVGCGWIAQAVHIPILAASTKCNVRAICDPHDRQLGRAARLLPQARPCQTVEQALEDPGVTAVIAAVPPGQNRKVAEAVLSSGRDLYLEKPLAPTTADGAAIVAAAKSGGGIAVIGFNFRRNPAVEMALGSIKSGALGQIVSIQSQVSWETDPTATWRADSAVGGGALMDLASHHIDLVLQLSASTAAAASASFRSVRAETDTADVQIQLENGVVAQIQASSAVGGNVNRLSVAGTTGRLDLDLLEPGPNRLIRGAPAYGRRGRLQSALSQFHPLAALTAPGGEPSFAAALNQFVDACLARASDGAGASLASGLEVLRTVELATASGRDRAGAGSTP